MNARMLELLDLLAQREEDEPGYIEILPPLATEAEPQIAARLVTVAPAPSEELEAA